MDYSTMHKAGELPYTGVDLFIPLLIVTAVIAWAALIAWWAE